MGKIKDIQWVDRHKLKPYENNAKIHSDEQLEKLSKSIKEFGFLNPVLIDKDFNIIAGHGRVMAAERSKIRKIPCVCIDGLTEAQRKAYILADNRLSEFGEWDNAVLDAELDELLEMDFDISDFEFGEIVGGESLTIPREYYGDERERTNNAYNLDLAHHTEMTADF